MRVLLTGHNGYLGSVIAPILRAAGHEIIGLDTFYYEDCNLIDDPIAISTIRKDIRDITVADLQGFEAVVHMAALSNDPLGDLNPELTHDINYTASVQLAQRAKEAGVRRFLFSSSCSMYGVSGDDRVTEAAPLNPMTPYALSKVRTEEDLNKLADDDFSPVYMRNATVYGVAPRLRADVVLNNLVCWAYTTGIVKILSDGTPWRPMVHVRDLAQVCVLLLAAPLEKIHNQAFNVGADDQNYRIRELAEIVAGVVADCTLEIAGKHDPDNRSYRVDFSKLANTFPEFRPQWDARKGAEELYETVHRVGLTQADFQGGKFTRLARLKILLDTQLINESLRWTDAS